MLIGLQLRDCGPGPVCRGIGFLAALAITGRQTADVTARSASLRTVTRRERSAVTRRIPSAHYCRIIPSQDLNVRDRRGELVLESRISGDLPSRWRSRAPPPASQKIRGSTSRPDHFATELNKPSATIRVAGGVAERSNAAVSKTMGRVDPDDLAELRLCRLLSHIRAG
jgi:hypothetical protein